MREYLLRGGELISTSIEWNTFFASMHKVFPDRPIVDIPDSDPIFHTIYDLEHRYQVAGMPALEEGHTYEKGETGKEPHWRAIYDDYGHIISLPSFNMDLGDSGEHADDLEHPKFSDLGIRLGSELRGLRDVTLRERESMNWGSTGAVLLALAVDFSARLGAHGLQNCASDDSRGVSRKSRALSFSARNGDSRRGGARMMGPEAGVDTVCSFLRQPLLACGNGNACSGDDYAARRRRVHYRMAAPGVAAAASALRMRNFFVYGDSLTWASCPQRRAVSVRRPLGRA